MDTFLHGSDIGSPIQDISSLIILMLINTLQLNGVPGVHESVLLSQLVDPPRLVKVAVERGSAGL